jgi:adenylate kinase family enzyme
MAAAAEDPVNRNFWCERVRVCFDTFVKRPTALQHMLLFGPPGSGKTTSAAWLVRQIWGSQSPLMSMFLNAADERSLEAIRQKIFPFVQSSWVTGLVSSTAAPKPRFLILDECETLTEAAQLSLQAILDRDPLDMCVVLICNSQSRIHPKLRQRLLKIRYDPPRGLSAESTPTAFHEISRGDMRFHDRRPEIEERLWNYLHTHPDLLVQMIESSSADAHTIVTEIMLLATLLQCLDATLLAQINSILPFLGTGLQMENVHRTLVRILQGLRTSVDAPVRGGIL